MLNVLFALIGLFTGGIINVLADDWAKRERPSRPHCPNPDCDHVYGPAGWLAVIRWARGEKQCPQCGRPARRRPLVVEVATALLFALLPALISPLLVLVVYAFYTAVLILIIVIDLENRLILDIVTLPGTALALLFSFFLPNTIINPTSAVLGAVIGFVLFLIIYAIAKVTFGPGAIGQGDVKLALLMGAMLGVPDILVALMIGILFGGFVSGFLLATRLVKRNTYLPYGQYLAAAAIVMLLWGEPITDWIFA